MDTGTKTITLELSEFEAAAVVGALESWVDALGDDYPEEAEAIDEVVKFLWSKSGGAK